MPDGSRIWVGSGTAYAKMDRADEARTRISWSERRAGGFTT
jgi:hypothetical protein